MTSAATLPAAQAGSRYLPIAELGQGGMADVLLALMRGAGGFTKLVVLKRLRQNLAEDPELVEMFSHEARLAARLNHPNVVQTYEVDYDAGRYFIAMEWLDGQPMHRLLRAAWSNDALPLDVHLFVLCEALRGLHYAHELQDFDGTPLEVVHRDVSPQNVFVTYEGQVKLVDFGVAKAHARSADTQVGVIKGKVAYMAPEQALGRTVDRRADVFSLGVMLWEAVARRRLWKGLSTSEIAAALAERRIPRLADAVQHAPHGLDAICARAMAPSPDERFSTAAELGQAIERVLERFGRPIDSRRIGAIVHGLFAEERARVRRVIEEQLGHVRLDSIVGPLPTSLPVLGEPSSAADTPSRSRRPSLEPTLREAPDTALSFAEDRRRRHALVGACVAGACVAGAVLFGVAATFALASTPPDARPAAATARPTATSDLPANETQPVVAAEPPVAATRDTGPTHPAASRKEAAPSSYERFEERAFDHRTPANRRARRTLDKEDPWE